MRIAIVTDWLAVYGGSERVLQEVLDLFPKADLFSLVDHLPEEYRSLFHDKKAITTFIQRFPFSKRLYRKYLSFMPAAIESLDLSNYDLIISISHAVAKGVLTTNEQLHISYLQARNLKYAYEDRPYYRKGKIIGFIEDLMLSKLRVWDHIATNRPDVIVANSRYVEDWYRHRHGVNAHTIYPPVNTETFSKQYSELKDDYYVTAARLEPYKRIDLIIKAFNKLGKKLVIIGDGTQMKELQQIAGPNIQFKGYCNSEKVAQLVSKAQAFIFPSREDFGIAPLEAQACGTPVIAYSKGGAKETIIGNGNHPTGLFFHEQTADALAEAVLVYEKERYRYESAACKLNAERFSSARFKQEFASFVDLKISLHMKNIGKAIGMVSENVKGNEEQNATYSNHKYAKERMI